MNPSSDIVSPDVTLPISTLLPLLGTGGYLLHAPAVSVRIAEEDTPDIVEVFSLLSRSVSTLFEELDITDIHAPLHQLGTCGAHVPDDQEYAINGAWLHSDGARSQMYRARRSGRGQLDEVDLIADPVVYVHVEPDLLRVEVSGAFHVRDRDRHDLYLPIHDLSPFGFSNLPRRRSTPPATLSEPRGTTGSWPSRTRGCPVGAATLRPSDTCCGRPDCEYLAGSRLAGHVGRNHEKCPAVLAAEHAGEAAAVELDRLQHLTAFANAHTPFVRDVPVPDCAFCIEADAVGDAVTEVGPYPPVRQSAVGSDVECREPVAVGLREDQRRVVGRNYDAIRERNPIRHLSSRGVGGEKGEDSGGELAFREFEADVADVGVAPAVHDDVVPG